MKDFLKLKHKTKMLESREILLNKQINQRLKQLKKIDVLDNKIKEKVYNEVRNKKLQNNEIIEVNGKVINLQDEDKKISNKIKNLINVTDKKPDYRYKALYLGYGNQGKLIDLPEIVDETIDINNSTYLLKEQKNKIIIDGKTFIIIDKNSIVMPEFNRKKKKFIFDIDPPLLWQRLNIIFDKSLTRPKDSQLLGGLNKKKIFIGLIIAGIIYAFMNQNKGG